MTINLGIYDQQQALDLVELVDQLGFDSISLGVTLGYAMDYNRQHPEQAILGGLSFGDFAATCDVIRQAAAGGCPEIGLGVKRLSEALGETDYAMHCKGLELPAYLPETNPGYPFAIAGGHMSMRTFLLLVFEGRTELDYWVDAIVNKGIYYTRDDLLGLCKFAGTPDAVIEPSFRSLFGVEVTTADLMHATQRTYLRGLLLERKQGAHPGRLRPPRPLLSEQPARATAPLRDARVHARPCGSRCSRLSTSRLRNTGWLRRLGGKAGVTVPQPFAIPW